MLSSECFTWSQSADNWAPLVAQTVKRLSAMRGRVPPPGGEDALEKEMATRSSTPAREIP